MAHEYAIRFKPISGGKLVRLDAYTQALAGIVEGLNSLRAALAPQLAATRGWSVPVVRSALTFSVGPTAKGSLVVPLVAGGSDAGAPLDVEALARTFWSEATQELNRVSKKQAALLSASGAEAFARASAAASDAHAKVSLASRASSRAPWRSQASLTQLEPALRRHAQARRSGHRATTALSGRIVSLTYDPPSFVLATTTSRYTVRMPSALRDSARASWGHEVVVLTDAAVAADGSVADVSAIDIQPAASADRVAQDFDNTFGVMRGSWDKGALESYLGKRH